MTLLGSASGLHRSLECPASVHLPHTRERHPKVQAAADRGTGLHTYAELIPAGWNPDAALQRIKDEHGPRVAEEARQLKLEHWPGSHPHARREIAFAHHGLTGEVRVLGESIGRDYEVTDPYETPGTADCVIVGFKTLEVYDLKTGRTPVPPARFNPQLLHLALCAMESLAPAAESAVIGIATLDKAKRVKVTDQATVTRAELAEHEQRVVRAQRVALRVIDAIKAGVEPELNPGPGCAYCEVATCRYAR